MDVHAKWSAVWALICVSLTLLTIPGLALFYGGMVRRKNILSTIGLPFAAVALASAGWPLWLALRSLGGGAVRSGDPLGSMSVALAGALALALVSGAVVERVRLPFFLVFGGLWLALVFGPVARWLWGDGWLVGLGSLDFAGGAVIHVTAGVTALAL